MRTELTSARNGAIRLKMKKGAILFLTVAGFFAPGCVRLTAPDKPIVINLNIAIRQEVLIKLDEASRKVVEENAGIF